jgi:hypothetical protein
MYTVSPIIVAKIITFVAILVLGQTLSNMLREHSSTNCNDLKNPF